MRLTLRTLLAYMDDMLDPADQEELARKIEASPFATELIHRSRDAVRRLRLSAPEPLAAESGDLHGGDHYLDANTAAEYLDSILPPDEVGEFERHCLEAGPNADMLLAEAVSCHHILTLVLGEPAEVDADLRQRMYQIVEHSQPQQLRVEGSHRTPHLEPAQPAAASLMRRPRVDADEASVPDYILEAARAQRRSRNRMIGMMVLAGAIGGIAAFLLWPQKEITVAPDVARAGNQAKGGVETGAGESADAGPQETDVDATEAAIEAGGEAPTFVPGPASAVDSASTPTAPAPDGGAATESADTTASTELAPAAGGTSAPVQSVEVDVANLGVGAGAVPPSIAGLPPETGLAPLEGAATPNEATVAVDSAPGSTVVPPTTGPLAPPENAGTPDSTPPPVPSDPGATVATAPTGSVPPGETLAGALPTTAGADALPGTATPPELPTADAGATTTTDAGAAAPEATPDAGATAADAANEFSGEGPTEPAEEPRTVGAYLGLNNDLLLRYSPDDAAWVRLPPRSTLTAGDRLLVLPNFRTLAVLGADVNAFIGGGTEVKVTAPGGGDAGDVGFELPYGRVILNAGLNGNHVALTLGDQTRVIALGPSSSLAVEVTRTFVPGSNPVETPAPVAVSWYLTTGKAEWNDGATDHSAEGPATWTTVDGVDQAPLAIDELPNWIDKEPITNIEAGARDAVAERLIAGDVVNTPLLELTSPTGLGRRTEVRSLAARSGAYVGEFEALVKALADPAERARRKEQVETLRAAIARNPESVEQIHAAFELQRGDAAADDLTEMLLGYSAADVGTTRDEVKQGVLVRLINWLNDDDLAYRVLASHNINDITGTTYLGGYRPEHSASQRQREMRYYWDRLEKGELTPR